MILLVETVVSADVASCESVVTVYTGTMIQANP